MPVEIEIEKAERENPSVFYLPEKLLKHSVIIVCGIVEILLRPAGFCIVFKTVVVPGY